VILPIRRRQARRGRVYRLLFDVPSSPMATMRRRHRGELPLLPKPPLLISESGPTWRPSETAPATRKSTQSSKSKTHAENICVCALRQFPKGTIRAGAVLEPIDELQIGKTQKRDGQLRSQIAEQPRIALAFAGGPRTGSTWHSSNHDRHDHRGKGSR
jgi:hypothetical protein